MSKKVQIVEVGPRDGLQNEKTTLSVPMRLAFINHLARADLNGSKPEPSSRLNGFRRWITAASLFLNCTKT